MDVLQYWKTEQKKAAEDAQAIITSARDDGRGLDDDERGEVERLTGVAHGFGEKIHNEESNQKLEEGVRRLGNQLASEPEKLTGAAARTWGEAFVGSEMFDALKIQGLPSGGGTSPQVDFMASVGDPLLPQTGQNADTIPEQFIRSLETPGLRQEQPTLADLFTTVQVDSPTVSYPKLVTRTKADGQVISPGEDKPYAEYAFDKVTVSLDKRAAFVAVAEEMITDAPYIKSFIDQDLPFMVRQNEETAFVLAFYTAVTAFSDANDLTGGTNVWDAIMAGVTDVRVNFFAEPDGLFIHPLDWAAASISKASTSGSYFSGGPNATPSTNLWGTPARVVISSKAVQGFPIVGNFKLGGKVYRKGGVRLDASNSHDDFFQKNLVAIRAEVRSVLGITYPEAFSKIDLAS